MAEVKDNKTAGPKTADSKRTGEVDDPALREAANRAVEDNRGRVFGDNTSSTGGANTAGQHGRDGGEINDTTNNPAPTKEVTDNEAGARVQKQLEEEAKDSDKDEE